MRRDTEYKPLHVQGGKGPKNDTVEKREQLRLRSLTMTQPALPSLPLPTTLPTDNTQAGPKKTTPLAD